MSKIHIMGLPHNDTIRATAYCAYAQKFLKLSNMLTADGHEVYYYGGPYNEGKVKEHIVVVTEEDRSRWFGTETWEERVFDRWNAEDPCWTEMNERVIEEINKRIEPKDIIGITMGGCQASIVAAFPNNISAEVGVGYEGVLTNTHRCFESEAWRHYIYGKSGVNDGLFYDTVIPNAFDPLELSYSAKKEDYLLFLGRLTARKGLGVITELAKHHRVITAGQGDERVPGAEHVGVVIGKEKADLLANAKALLSPTLYIGPFEGVNVEAQMSGTPVLTTHWGCYTETLEHGKTGYRCHTLGDFLWAVDHVSDLDPAYIRERAIRLYSVEAVAPQYTSWFNQLETLYGPGWYWPERTML